MDGPVCSNCMNPTQWCICKSLNSEPQTASAETLAYVPGTWRCPKCLLRIVSTNLHVNDGGMSANNSPHTCDNCGTPMWRVTEREDRQEAQRLYIALFDEVSQLRAERDKAQADLAAALVDARTGGNYVADREVEPHEVRFANGRIVRVVGDGYLEIEHAPL